MLKNKVSMFPIRFLLVVIFTANLTACGGDDFTDLQQYMKEVESRPESAIKPFPEFKAIEPFIFKSTITFRDPFKAVEKEKVEEDNEENSEEDNGIHPDLNRVKGTLESFELTGLRLVGTVDMDHALWGLIRGTDNVIYRVKKGDYIGRNDGKITQIDKKKIDLVEILPTTPKRKRFTEQSATLTLSE